MLKSMGKDVIEAVRLVELRRRVMAAAVGALLELPGEAVVANVELLLELLERELGYLEEMKGLLKG